jgi:hypothetical protein
MNRFLPWLAVAAVGLAPATAATGGAKDAT